MNKKGFTLVELLAVIAMLGILLVLVVPNILRTFNSAKVDSFITESKSIISSARKQYYAEQITTKKKSVIYCYDGRGVDENKLQLTGGSDTHYKITVLDGEVVDVLINDNKHALKLESEDSIHDSEVNNSALVDLDENLVNCEG